MKQKLSVLFLTAFMAISSLAFAEIPKILNYQGRLTDASGNAINGTKAVTFRLYNVETGGTPLWSEDHTVVAQKGVFSVLLGSTSASPLNLAFDEPYYIEIVVEGTEMTPRMPLAVAAYAMRAETTTVLDEDDMSSNSDQYPPSQQSVKNYVDNYAPVREYIKVSDVKASGTNGGPFTSGSWLTRDINTEDSDAGNNCVISNNQIILQPGTYECRIDVPAMNIQEHKARLYNISTGTTEILGTSERSEGTNADLTKSVIVGRFTIDSQSTFEIQHRCSSTNTSINSLGSASSFGVNEVYTVAEFWKVD